jgi:hypothetical protein
MVNVQQKITIKNVLLFAAIGLVSFDVCAAVDSGLYLGLMAGSATNAAHHQAAQLQGVPATVSASPNASQFGSRIYLGNKFNQYAGLEAGFSYFSPIKYHASSTLCSTPEAQVRDFDVVGVGTLPIGRSFSAFGKAGIAFSYVTSTSSLNPNLADSCGGSAYTTSLKPAFALGASYDLNKSWVADVSWTRLVVGHMVNRVDFYALGLTYHFVDVSCGPFFCF